ncbi:hypothetical protein RJ639_001641 [Escallonia herrerae]|uniref:F-box domain-containing protein n=1 Tax=Escallonia herrerae TaxID=1293975 RepID=A0AA88XI53_9ASTE|nr:hypothetical protein RJ639_001641 [Escallonia herrerae]
MESHRSSTTNAVGLCLLPSELIQYIFLRLSLPDVFQFKSVSKSIAFLISDQDFVRDYNLQSSSATWLFVYKKRWHRDAVLQGFTDCSNRWFKVPIADTLKQMIPRGEDLYFLAASGDHFLFALNTSQEVISVNPVLRTVKRIPPSPLGPRGTSLWRRSGMKLLSRPPEVGHFRFLFAEMNGNFPVLFEYSSKTDKWHSTVARENFDVLRRCNRRERDHTFLSIFNGRNESVLIAAGSQGETPMVVRPRFHGGGNEEGQLAVGFGWGNAINRLQFYGDGNMVISRSEAVDVAKSNTKLLVSLELWSLSSDGRCWEFISNVPRELIDQIKKPYGVIMGCLEEKKGTVRVLLMSNFEGVWDIIWLCFSVGGRQWTWVPLPDCKMKGSNLAGITFSSGLSLS